MGIKKAQPAFGKEMVRPQALGEKRGGKETQEVKHSEKLRRSLRGMVKSGTQEEEGETNGGDSKGKENA